jgi:leucine dehydrogenase
MDKNTHSYAALMRYAKLLGFGEIHTKIDNETGLTAIIAIHNTQLGPAIGGCRLKPYRSTDSALKDVMRLAFMMTLKAAISDLPHGGAKAVIIEPKKPYDRKALFRSFGDFVHEMHGRYITAMDFGTETSDMDIIAERTPYVIGAANTHASLSGPGPDTALGVFRGIQAAVKFKLKRNQLENTHVAIQGMGHVGYTLAKMLYAEGAQLTIADPKQDTIQRCRDEFQANVVDIKDIYQVKCDVFAPCALGSIINKETIDLINAPIVAGSANNQLIHHKYGKLLFDRDILYAPDFIINAGGLISAAMIYDYNDKTIADKKIDEVHDILLDLFERSARENKPTTDVARDIAMEKLRLPREAI